MEARTDHDVVPIRDNFLKRKVDKFDFDDLGWIEKIPECMVFHPSREEFEDPIRYLETIAPLASGHGNNLLSFIFLCEMYSSCCSR